MPLGPTSRRSRESALDALQRYQRELEEVMVRRPGSAVQGERQEIRQNGLDARQGFIQQTWSRPTTYAVGIDGSLSPARENNVKEGVDVIQTREKEWFQKFLEDINSAGSTIELYSDTNGNLYLRGTTVDNVAMVAVYKKEKNVLVYPAKRSAHLKTDLQELANRMGWGFETARRMPGLPQGYQVGKPYAFKGWDMSAWFKERVATYIKGDMNQPSEGVAGGCQDPFCVSCRISPLSNISSVTSSDSWFE